MINITVLPQPGRESWKFVEELAKPVKWHFNWQRLVPVGNEAALGNGVAIEKNFPDADAGQGNNILLQMWKLALEEMDNSAAMLGLCENDPRLGFHPEAEGYKYFPKKLMWLINLLRSLLEEDFPEACERLVAGQKAFPEEAAKTYCCNSGKYEYAPGFNWKADCADGILRISIDDFKSSNDSSFKIFLEDKPFFPPREFNLNNRDEIEIPLPADAMEVGFNVCRTDELIAGNGYGGWIAFHPRKVRLILGTYDPQAKGKLILKNDMTDEKNLNDVPAEGNECGQVVLNVV